jgi:protein gp37
MAEHTEISWADSTFNPWIGCTRVSPGCDRCYAATLMDDRYGRVKWGSGEARQRTKTWDQPRRWNRLAVASGKPWRVFCASLADVFDNEVPDEWRDDLWTLIRETPALTWMLLTKRVGNIPGRLPSDWRSENYSHVWLGITAVNQVELDRDWPKLATIGTALRWLSLEPLLGPISLERIWWPDWVIVGGESGPGARTMQANWVRGLRDECAAREIPFHFKQWGGARPKSSGHLLDGHEHRAFPA